MDNYSWEMPVSAEGDVREDGSVFVTINGQKEFSLKYLPGEGEKLMGFAYDYSWSDRIGIESSVIADIEKKLMEISGG